MNDGCVARLRRWSPLTKQGGLNDALTGKSQHNSYNLFAFFRLLHGIFLFCSLAYSEIMLVSTIMFPFSSLSLLLCQKIMLMRESSSPLLSRISSLLKNSRHISS